MGADTQASTTEIQGIIDRLQKGSRQVVSVIDEVSGQVAKSSAEFHRADEHFDQINQLLGSLQKRALKISAVAGEQGGNATEVSVSVTDIARMSGERAAAMERSDQASGDIAEMLEALQAKASQFRV